jgi:hypothetical protein
MTVTEPDRYITAQISSGCTGEITSEVIVDSKTGDYVATEQVGPHAAELFGLFGALAQRITDGTLDLDSLLSDGLPDGLRGEPGVYDSTD